ncbi:LiaI-LiaF-like domain-containing protein [Chloroflexota bacterium]
MNLQRERAFLAGVLILVGILFLLANLDAFDLDIGSFAATWWPCILIFLGLWRLVADRGANPIGPLCLIGLGIVLQVIMLDWAGWSILWPLIIVGIGVLILFQGRPLRHRPTEAPSGEDTLDLYTMFGGIERRITSQRFRGGKVTAIFGGIELDLREAQLVDGASLNATVLFGGLELRVPESWNVQVHGSPLFGAIEDPKGARLAQDRRSDPTLQLYASVTFGGLEIKR